MNLVQSIKNQVQKQGQSKSQFLYFKPDVKIRVRFLCEFDEGMEVVFHDSFEKGINTPCLDIFGKTCPYCSDDEVRTRSKYIWSVWDYDANEVRLICEAVSQCSPVAQLCAMYENYGTILDRDYVIEQKGRGKDKTFVVIPADKVKFTNTKAAPFSQSKIKSLLAKAYSVNNGEDDEIPFAEESEATKNKFKNANSDDIDWETDGVKESEENEWKQMTAKELYKLCKEQKLDVEPKMKPNYYITKLKEARKAKSEWGDNSEDWEDEDE